MIKTDLGKINLTGYLYPKKMADGYNSSNSEVYASSITNFLEKNRTEDNLPERRTSNLQRYGFTYFERMDNLLEINNPNQEYWLTVRKERKSKAESNKF